MSNLPCGTISANSPLSPCSHESFADVDAQQLGILRPLYNGHELPKVRNGLLSVLST